MNSKACELFITDIPYSTQEHVKRVRSDMVYFTQNKNGKTSHEMLSMIF